MEEEARRLIPVPREDRERRALRGFGIGLGLILLYFAWRGRWRPDILANLGGMCLALVATAPHLFRPLFRVWMPVVGVLARVNLWLVCGILYYLVVTPWGLFLRALGLRPLELRLRTGDSYWEVVPARDPAESARRIF